MDLNRIRNLMTESIDDDVPKSPEIPFTSVASIPFVCDSQDRDPSPMDHRDLT
jgi:hypothetical protein